MPLKKTLTISPTSIPYQCTTLVTLENYISAMYDAIPLIFVKWDKQVDGSYVYQIKAADGRLWKQTITPIPGDSLQTFQVSDVWKLSEFTLQRPIRELLIQTISDLSLTNFSMVYTVV